MASTTRMIWIELMAGPARLPAPAAPRPVARRLLLLKTMMDDRIGNDRRRAGGRWHDLSMHGGLLLDLLLRSPWQRGPSIRRGGIGLGVTRRAPRALAFASARPTAKSTAVEKASSSTKTGFHEA